MNSWSTVSNPVENVGMALESVSIVNRNDIWSVGWLGKILHWNGASWETVPSAVGYDLVSVYMIDANDGWIVGAGGAILRWNGVVWSSVSNPTGNNYGSVFMLNSNDGWAVGDGILRWDGTTWSPVSSPTTKTLTSVSMLSSIDGWAVGEDGIILHWNGAVWNSVTSPTTTFLSSVFMLDGNDGWAVGRFGIVLHWDGINWNLVASPTTSNLYSVFMLSSNDGWAVGESIIHWDGSELSLVANPLSGLGTFWPPVIRSVSMIDSDEGWAVGSDWVVAGSATREQRPRILHYGEGAPTPPAVGVWSCDSLGNPQDVFMVGDSVYVFGRGYSPSTTYDVYVVEDTDWIDNMAIPNRVELTEKTLTSNVDGTVQPSLVWFPALPSPDGSVQEYDIIIDVNKDGKYNMGIDALDELGVKTAGLLIADEMPFGSLAALIGTLLALVVFSGVKRKQNRKNSKN